MFRSFPRLVQPAGSAVVALSIAAAAVLWPQTASATGSCGPRAAIVEQLATRHGEQRVALGLAASGQVMELWTGLSGGWTLLATRPDGVACVVAVGEQLQRFEPQTPADPA